MGRSGYPRGLKGESIPVEGRIVAVADVFDALTTTRPYKQPWSAEQAIGFLRENAGSHFDPAVVETFIARRGDIMAVMEQLRD